MRIRLKGRCLARLACPGALLIMLLPQQVLAEGCLLSPAKLSDATLSAFKAKPGELLERFPGGGPAMSGEIMRHAGTDIALLPDIIELARRGAIAHRVAIGIGLAKAATTCGRMNGDFERAIKQAVADSGLSELITAFAAGLSSIELSAAPHATSPTGSGVGGGGEIASGPLASAGGGKTTASGGGGGGGGIIVGIELLGTQSSGSFSSRALTSTRGSTVSPTRQ
jgi:hypothetical protein